MKAGRKTKSENKRSETVIIRVTPLQKEFLEMACKQKGLSQSEILMDSLYRHTSKAYWFTLATKDKYENEFYIKPKEYKKSPSSLRG